MTMIEFNYSFFKKPKKVIKVVETTTDNDGFVRVKETVTTEELVYEPSNPRNVE